jgi:hypothetical protein
VGATCTATETVPAGYTADESACLNVAITTGACTITNTLNTAVFQVSKDFSDDNAADVTVSLVCTSGTVVNDDTTASEADPANFTVNGFDVGATCTASETVPAGYTSDEATNCLNVAVSTGACTITNTVQAGFGLGWGDLDCNGSENVRDGQWLLTSLLGSPISQTEPCPDLGEVP